MKGFFVLMILFIYLWAYFGCMWAFSGYGELGLLFLAGHQASHCGGSFHITEHGLRVHGASVVVALQA